MKGPLNFLMLSCKKASELIDLKSIKKLTAKERILLKMHLSLCDGCTAYAKHSKILDNLIHRHEQNQDDSGVPPLVGNNELKQRIIANL